ncbi:MAG: carbohydrate binding family 9 domain-containing protein [Saprospiraceae bacterium]|nr:carbohydrate binding family 9 domain-containing protein [Saprospiraceae bacterium]
MKRNAFVTMLLLLAAIALTAQSPDNKRLLTAQRISERITVDGVLNEPVWAEAAVASDFVQTAPFPGAASAMPVQIKVIYDNSGLYIGATLFDSRPDSILNELTQRDRLGNSDVFGVFIDSYRDGLNGFAFLVTPAGVQVDLKITPLQNNNNGNQIVTSGEDIGWDAVWFSKCVLHDQGWTAEIHIPFAALRFPKTEQQTWHINFGRMIRRYNEMSFWNTIDPQINGFLIQSGLLNGLENIKAPLRLQATPFLAVYGLHHHDKNGTPKDSYGRSFNGGMDVKYGISDAFTLDMTLIPDFGEAQSDNQILNLSPFEVQFNENRQFFTEGTELFNKGGIFYSRRIGGQPLHYGKVYDQIGEGETLVSNPQQSKLFNAAKVSGRTANGLGLGLFNATSGRSTAVVRGTDGTEREIETDPLTNYTVLVADKNLKNNSFATLINTTVWRSGQDYDANVTGAVFDFRNKTNTYGLRGKGVVSQLYRPGDTELGHTFNIGVGKISGQWQGGISYNEESDKYNPNDLGFLFNNNERSVGTELRFNQYKPFGKFNSAGAGMYLSYSRLYNPNVFTNFGANFWAWVQTKSFWNFEMWSYHEPMRTFDYFEARTTGRYYHFPTNNNVGFWTGSDNRKQIRISFNTNFRTYGEDGRFRWNVNFSPRYRVNDKLTLSTNTYYGRFRYDVGFAAKTDPVNGGTQPEVIFGKRHIETVENIFNASYTFNPNTALTLRARHYWTSVHYQSFHLLTEKGELGETNFNESRDANFNAFNVDMIFRWRFAPGSDLFVIWKNSVLHSGSLAGENYFSNWDNLFEAPQDNSLSVKMIYFLDYQSFMQK